MKWTTSDVLPRKTSRVNWLITLWRVIELHLKNVLLMVHARFKILKHVFLENEARLVLLNLALKFFFPKNRPLKVYGILKIRAKNWLKQSKLYLKAIKWPNTFFQRNQCYMKLFTFTESSLKQNLNWTDKRSVSSLKFFLKTEKWRC